MPLSEVLNREIIITLLPLIPIGFLSGYIGVKIKKGVKKGRITERG
ncbi:hypothetical protein BMS3Abin10_01969 [bacterium BMS3Abin10]|nr:hypothetical protein BMS3Abin10_01969 [bacterium BMS3Abin10]GBE38176.1 hypothetical protein BMS3Bbin08_00779 [bacterium BMS3Bbin08]